jgi:hypothetical protein
MFLEQFVLTQPFRDFSAFTQGSIKSSHKEATGLGAEKVRTKDPRKCDHL